jgi:hypothetical protein
VCGPALVKAHTLDAAIRQATVTPGSAAVCTRRVHEEAVPTIRSLRGCQAYDVVYGADARVTTGRVLEDRTAADECHRRIRDIFR